MKGHQQTRGTEQASQHADAVKERSIILSGPMICQLLAGRKTQMRMAVGLKTLQRSGTHGYDWTFRGRAPIRSIAGQRRYSSGCWQDISHARMIALCPYGVVGDRLWVRETWQSWRQTSVEYDEWEIESDPDMVRHGHIEYMATSSSVGPWRSPIFMPRCVSRITLEITAVRVQRLQEISEADARAEGVEPYCDETRDDGTGRPDDHRAAFADLWNGINAKSEKWDSNPWVWAISFEKVDAT